MKRTNVQYPKKFLSFLFLSVLVFGVSQNVIARSPGQDALDLGTSLYKQGKFKEAAEAYKLATQKDPALMKAWENLGWANHKTGNPGEAEKIWKMLLKVEPLNISVLNALGTMYLETEQWKKAIQSLSKVLKLDTGLDDTRLKLGDAYKGIGKWSKAIAQYKKVLKRHPHDTHALFRVADAYAQTDRMTKAINTLKRHLSGFKGEDVESKQKLARLYANQGKKFYTDKQYQKAVGAYKSALHWRPLYPLYLKNLGWAYWQRAQWRDCEATWLLYADKFADRSGPYNLLTHLYLRLGKNKKALKTVERSLRIDADQPDEQLNRARALNANQKYKEAMVLSRRLTRLYPNHLSINTYWGGILMQRHDFKQGQKQWRKVLNLGSDTPRAYYYWIKSMYENGKYTVAVNKAEDRLKKGGSNRYLVEFLRDDALIHNDRKRAIEFETQLLGFPEMVQNPQTWLDLAALYRETNQYQKARQTLEDALIQHSENVSIKLALADVYRVTRNHGRAHEIFSEIYRAHPFNHPAFTGLFSSLNGLRQYRKAFRLLENNERPFFTDRELEMQQARLAMLLNRDGYRYQEPTDTVIHIPILLYHGLSQGKQSRNLTVALFADQLAALRREGYTAITVRELAEMVDRVIPFPKKPVLITFDDARIDSFQLADPVLKKYGMKATMFVPTSMILDDHPFFADWRMIRHYRRTGRWDMQSHGHHAHDLIDVNASGEKGQFLANYRWLTDARRHETPDEFALRLRNDYKMSARLLKKHLPGSAILGYSFPYSEMGQLTGGNARDALKVNEASFDRYFRFGFIQDSSGYNRIIPGDHSPRFLRRTGVESTWDGERLLRHLASFHPLNQEKLFNAKLYFYQHENEKSEAILNTLREEVPSLSQEIRYYLAANAYQQGLYRKAGSLLIDPERSEEREESYREAKLKDNITWWNRPRLGVGFRLFSDSDDRENIYWSTKFIYPLKSPVDLWIAPGAATFREDGESTLHAKEITTGVDWRASEKFRISASTRLRKIDDSEDTANGWLSVRYGTYHQGFRFHASREDIDTVSARKADIQTNNYGIEYTGRYRNLWMVRLAATHRDYSDNNKRNDFRFAWQHYLPGIPYWQVGVDIGYSDTENDVGLYYTPQELKSVYLNAAYRRTFDADLALDAAIGVGGVKDATDDIREGVRLTVSLKKKWGSRWQSEMNLIHSDTGNYDSTVFNAGITFRF